MSLKCPLCGKTKQKKQEMLDHIESFHADTIPETMSTAQYVYSLIHGRDDGLCRVCGKPTLWNEKTGKPKQLCEDKSCKEKRRIIARQNMIKVYGKESLLNDPLHQEKMLANRKISGTYNWSDNKHKFTYTGSYEKFSLEWLDKVYEYDPDDIQMPGPIVYYDYNGEKHPWITDMYLESLNLVIEFKDGSFDRNTHAGFSENRVRESAKDEYMKNQSQYNYTKITNKNMMSLVKVISMIRLDNIFDHDKKEKDPVVVIHESIDNISNTYKFNNIDNLSFNDTDILNESISNEKLYPVYVLLQHSGTALANIIKKVTNSHFSHSSISFDSSLTKMYSFGRKADSNPFIGTFKTENIEDDFFSSRNIPYALYVAPCTATQVKMMKKRLDYFIKNSTKFKYDFTGLIKNYFGIADNPEYKWFCSRFVADILNAGAPQNHPFIIEPSLMRPEDFTNTNFAIYVTGGSLSTYDKQYVDKIVSKIMKSEKAKRINNSYYNMNESISYNGCYLSNSDIDAMCDSIVKNESVMSVANISPIVKSANTESIKDSTMMFGDGINSSICDSNCQGFTIEEDINNDFIKRLRAIKTENQEQLFSDRHDDVTYNPLDSSDNFREINEDSKSPSQEDLETNPSIKTDIETDPISYGDNDLSSIAHDIYSSNLIQENQNGNERK